MAYNEICHHFIKKIFVHTAKWRHGDTKRIIEVLIRTYFLRREKMK